MMGGWRGKEASNIYISFIVAYTQATRERERENVEDLFNCITNNNNNDLLAKVAMRLHT